MPKYKYHEEINEYTSDEDGVGGLIIKCPKCGCKFCSMYQIEEIDESDDRKSNWGRHGGLLVMTFCCEECHRFEICVGFHKGQSILFSREKYRIDYHEYILSPEWKAKADEAKRRAGGKCQVCNKPGLLDAHHRTYERLGNELPEDITVLCRDCHELYELNRKEKKAATNGAR